MVKRAKSPNLVDDARYLAVWQPYPLNGNWELSEDYVQFAFWIASVLGTPRPILGIHHKPSARSMVLLEIDKKASHHALLGEHRWTEVLKKPCKEDAERRSQIFYCIYSTTRDAQKDGWKRIHVESDWFVSQKWDPQSGPFKYPYPDTHWCPELPEDPTNKRITRPLPVAVKTPPPAVVPPPLVPGSSQWVQAQKSGGSRPTRQLLQTAWAKGPPPAAAGRGRTNQPKPVVASTAASPPASKKKNKSAKNKGPAGGDGGSASQAQPSAPSSVASAVSPSASPSPAPATPSYPHAPPGLTRRVAPAPSSSSANASASDSLAQVRASFYGIGLVGRAWADDEEDEDEEDVGMMRRMVMTEEMEEEEIGYRPLEDSSGGEIDPDEIDIPYGGWGASVVVVANAKGRGPAKAKAGKVQNDKRKKEEIWERWEREEEMGAKEEKEEKEAVVENLWANIEPKKDQPEGPLCSVHGKLCKKGICAERKLMDRAAARLKAEEDKKAAEAAKRKRKREARAARKREAQGLDGGDWKEQEEEQEEGSEGTETKADGGGSTVDGGASNKDGEANGSVVDDAEDKDAGPPKRSMRRRQNRHRARGAGEGAASAKSAVASKV